MQDKMKKEIYKPYQIILIVFISCFLNVAGHMLSEGLNLPLWLDSFGTCLTAYVLGPVCGIIVGVSGNILHGFINPVSYVYSLVSVFIALIVGLFSRRGALESLLKTMSLSVLVTLVSVIISVILNLVFYDGDIGNEWGNGVVEEFSEWGAPRFLCLILGQFYTDFLDKVITLVALYLCIKLYRFLKPNLPGWMKSGAGTIKLSSLLFLLLAASFFFPQETYASSKKYNAFAHTVYNKEDGLIAGKANDIASTNDGILWIGAYEGLYRYNGIEFRLMTEFDSIKAVRCLYVDDEGRLFIGTNDNGLSIVINETVMNVLEAKNGLPSDYVRCITRGSDGLYYVGTSEALAVLTNSDGLRVVNVVPDAEGVISITADETEHIAAVTSKGMLCLLREQKIIWSSSGTREKYSACVFSNDGSLYATTESNRLMKFKLSSAGESIRLETEAAISCGSLKHINSLKIFDETLFICADNGVGYVEGKEFNLLETGAFNNSIDNMTEDYQGNLWFTSSRLGLLKLCETSFTELYASSALPVSVVNSTSFFNGGLYFGTDDGLMAVDGKTNEVLKTPLTESLSGVRVRCLYPAKDGSLWIATKQKGLYHALTNGTVKTFAHGHQMRVVTQLSDGTIAAGASDGLLFIRDERITQWLTAEDGFENACVLSLSETNKGEILAGTDGGGLAVIKPSSALFKIEKIITRKDGLSSNVVMRTVNDFESENPTEGIFVVTSNGLCYLDFSAEKEQKGKICRPLTNFPFSNNYDVIVREDGNVFVLSSAGIFVVNRDELVSGKKLDYELLDLKRGLRGSLTANSWNYLDEEGNLYLSCDTGSSRLNLNSYNKSDHSYRMQIKSVVLDGKRHIVQKDIPFVIPADCKSVEIVPEIINYSVKIPYISLFFEGVNQNPQVCLQSEVSSMIYTNLKSGNYKFHIAVLDSKGRETIEDTFYNISKEFRIYDHLYFKIYTVAVAMLAIVWLTWYVTSIIQGRRLEKQRKEMEIIRNQVRMGNETIFAIANAVEARDKRTGRHSYRVAEYSVMIAKELGFTEEEQNQIRRTGLLHDIGKIGVPDSILNKPTKLTDEEYEIMKTHTIIGGEILKDFTFIPHVDEGAKFHHEHYDGSGYPNGLMGEEIPLNARIIGIADAFDAMTADRIYRNALDMDIVIAEIEKYSGKQFDPGLVEIMLELIASGKLSVEKIMEESVEK